MGGLPCSALAASRYALMPCVRVVRGSVCTRASASARAHTGRSAPRIAPPACLDLCPWILSTEPPATDAHLSSRGQVGHPPTFREPAPLAPSPSHRQRAGLRASCFAHPSSLYLPPRLLLLAGGQQIQGDARLPPPPGSAHLCVGRVHHEARRRQRLQVPALAHAHAHARTGGGTASGKVFAGLGGQAGQAAGVGSRCAAGAGARGGRGVGVVRETGGGQDRRPQACCSGPSHLAARLSCLPTCPRTDTIAEMSKRPSPRHVPAGDVEGRAPDVVQVPVRDERLQCAAWARTLQRAELHVWVKPPHVGSGCYRE